MENIEDLIDKGNEIASMNDRINAHESSIQWTNSVRQWLAEIIPGSGYSAEWASLGASDLVMDNAVGSDPKEWNLFREMMNQRLKWLSKFQKEWLTPSVYNALILACEIEKFKFCGPSDDPDEQTAVLQNCLIFKIERKRVKDICYFLKTKIPVKRTFTLWKTAINKIMSVSFPLVPIRLAPA